MELIRWTDDLSIGVEEIDKQHRQLVHLVNGFHREVIRGHDKSGISRLFQGLIEYTVTHFATEEKYFEKTAYPDAEKHTREHDDLVRQVREIKLRFDEGRMVLSVEILNFLRKWLTDHIQESDKVFGRHMNGCGIR